MTTVRQIDPAWFARYMVWPTVVNIFILLAVGLFTTIYSLKTLRVDVCGELHQTPLVVMSLVGFGHLITAVILMVMLRHIIVSGAKGFQPTGNRIHVPYYSIYMIHGLVSIILGIPAIFMLKDKVPSQCIHHSPRWALYVFYVAFCLTIPGYYSLKRMWDRCRTEDGWDNSCGGRTNFFDFVTLFPIVQILSPISIIAVIVGGIRIGLKWLLCSFHHHQQLIITTHHSNTNSYISPGSREINLGVYSGKNVSWRDEV